MTKMKFKMMYKGVLSDNAFSINDIAEGYMLDDVFHTPLYWSFDDDDFHIFASDVDQKEVEYELET